MDDKDANNSFASTLVVKPKNGDGTKVSDTVKFRASRAATGDYSLAADSHIGLVRESNEDSYAYYADPKEDNFFVIVADGIGGHESGDIASALCVRLMLSDWRSQVLGSTKSLNKLRRFIAAAAVRANEYIYNLNKTFTIAHPMGTTVVAGIFTPGSLITAHIGDSRCYRLRQDKLETLTKDHSFVAELVKRKIINPEDARNHPFSHIISKSVGPALNIDPEINTFERSKGDRYLFCSDGLVNLVVDEDIKTIISRAKNPEDAVKTLLYTSLQEGGDDNITLITVFS